MNMRYLADKIRYFLIENVWFFLNFIAPPSEISNFLVNLVKASLNLKTANLLFTKNFIFDIVRVFTSNQI